MKTLASFFSQNSAGLAGCLLAQTKRPLLLTDAALVVLDCNEPFLELIGKTEKPLGRKLGELTVPGAVAEPPAGQDSGRLRLNFMDGQGETQSADCLYFRAEGVMLLLGERNMLLQSGAVSAISGLNDELVNVTRELQKKKAALEDALAKVRTLEGLLPICAACKNIRDDKGAWQPVESYIKKRTDTVFSHGICPSCAKKLYPGFSE